MCFAHELILDPQLSPWDKAPAGDLECWLPCYTRLQLSRLWLRRLPEHVQAACLAGLLLLARPALLTQLTGSFGT